MAGRVISKANMARIQRAHDDLAALGAQCGAAAKRLALKAADQGVFDLIDKVRQAMYQAVSMAEAQSYETYPHLEDVYPDQSYAIIEIGDAYYRAPYVQAADGSVALAARDQWVQVVEVWQPVDAAAMKAGALVADDGASVVASVKALGDRTLELRVAWGRDGHGEQFTPSTDFDLANFPAPPVLYYHGYKADGKPAPRPVVIGRTIKRENRADGHYLTAQLNDKAEAGRVWDAALKGAAFVSPGTAGHLRRREPDGTLTYWPIVEISAWDGAPSRKQAHPGSLAFPVLKALYLEAGLPVPEPLNVTPEAAGDAAGAVADIDPQTAGKVIAAEVAAALLALRSKDSTR